MTMAEAIMLGLIMGTATATTGYLKDKMFEPFELQKFARSPYLTAIGAIIGNLIYGPIPPLLIMSFSFLFERLTFELYKAFFRPYKKPGKFKNKNRDTRWVWRSLKNE